MLKALNYSINFLKKARRAPANSDLALAWEGLLTNVSYRLPAEAEHDSLIAVKTFWRYVKIVFSSSPNTKVLQSSSSIAILEGCFQFEELETHYVEEQCGSPVGYFMSKEDSARVQEGVLVKLAVIFRLFLFAIPIVFRTFARATHRPNQALVIAFAIENAGILHSIKQHRISHVYDFVPFLVDGNILSLMLIDNGVVISKLPSPGPLKTHNHILLGSELLLSSHYQFEEIKTLPNIRIAKVHKWLPEAAFSYIERYRAGAFVPRKKTIGFYSHGGWLRKSEGHADDGLNIPNAEHVLLGDLAKFFESHPEFSLKIFPHPREKIENLVDESQAFYKGYFGSTPFEMAGQDTRTTQSFEQCDIGLAAFSTILYERLFCGFKTLIGNYGIDDFPMTSSPLNNICFSSYSQLETALLSASEKSASDFFKDEDLTGYHYQDYPYFSKA